MEIEFDSVKRDKTLLERGLDFARAVDVFDAPYIEQIDNRVDYGEVRYMVFGRLDDEWIILIYTMRGETRRIISMRKANEREIRKLTQHMG